MPVRLPPVEPVRTRVAGPSADNLGTSAGADATFVCLVRGIGSGARTNTQVGRHIVDVCLPIFTQRATSMLDDLAELWWKGEHEGARVRPFSSLPIAERAELRARAKKLLADRTADTLGDQAVLEGETKRLLDLPEVALRRAHNDLERRAERDRAGWWNVGGATICAIFAAGRASIAHLGDCRAARLRRGLYEVLTEEHTLPAPSTDTLTRAVGLWHDGPERVVLPVERGDLFLFMTRALYRGRSADAIKTALRNHGPDAPASLALQGDNREATAVAVEIL